MVPQPYKPKLQFTVFNGVKYYDVDQAQRFGFTCPRGHGHCGGLLIAGRDHGIKRDPQNQNGGRAQWDLTALDTFAPSINCGGCGWHGFIEHGRCVDTNKRDEP